MGGIIISPCDTDVTAGVSSITGTPNQVIADQPTGDVTLSLPQDIATTSTPEFAGVQLDGSSSGHIILKANDATDSYTRKWPVDKGSPGQVLQTQGTGSEDMLWADLPSGGGGIEVLYSSVAEPGNVDSDPTQMYAWSSPADTLPADGDKMIIYGGCQLNNAGVTNISAKFNNVVLFDTEGSDFDGGSGAFSFFIVLCRVLNDNAMGHSSWNFRNGSIPSKADVFKASSQDFSGQANLIELIAQSASTNQVLGREFMVVRYKAPVVP